MNPHVKASDHCADCGEDYPSMHNSREVKRGIWPFRHTERERFPGFLCHKCWTLANPELFPAGHDALYPWLKQPKRLSETRAAVFLAAYMLAMLLAVGAVVWMTQRTPLIVNLSNEVFR